MGGATLSRSGREQIRQVEPVRDNIEGSIIVLQLKPVAFDIVSQEAGSVQFAICFPCAPFIMTPCKYMPLKRDLAISLSPFGPGELSGGTSF